MGIPTEITTDEGIIEGLEWSMAQHLRDVRDFAEEAAQLSPWPGIIAKYGSESAFLAACRRRKAADTERPLVRAIMMLMKDAPGRSRGKLRDPERAKMLLDRSLSAFWSSVSAAGDSGWNEERARIAQRQGDVRALLPLWRAWGQVLIDADVAGDLDGAFLP